MKKRLIALALLSAASGSALAASSTFQATVNTVADPVLTAANDLHFGTIQPQVGAACIMANDGSVSGDCDSSDANLTLGEITVSNLVPNVPLNVTVTGSDSADLSFLARFDITADTAYNDNANGTTVSVSTDALGSALSIGVYGTMSVLTSLTPGQTYTTDYTVDVSFQ